MDPLEYYKTMSKDRALKLIETEINLWRGPWQDSRVSLGEKHLILQRVIRLEEIIRELNLKNEEG